MFGLLYIEVIARVILSFDGRNNGFQHLGHAVYGKSSTVGDGQFPVLCRFKKVLNILHFESFQLACRHVLQVSGVRSEGDFFQNGAANRLHVLIKKLVAEACVLLHCRDRRPVGLRILQQIGEQVY